MKSKANQAVNDLAYLIYNVSNEKISGQQKINKEHLLIECLKLMSAVKMIYCEITSYNQTIKYKIDEREYLFWIVEIPDMGNTTAFVDYLTAELEKIFYNLM